MKRVMLGMVAALSLTSLARAESIETLFAEGNASFARGQAEQAAHTYERLIASGVADADVEYNAAVSAANAGALGRARWHIERARVLRAHDGGIERTREAILSSIVRRRAAHDGTEATIAGDTAAETYASMFGEDTWAWLVLFCELTCLASLTAVAFLKRDTLRMSAAISVAISGIVFLLSGAGLAIRRETFADGKRAVMLRDVQMLTAPAARGTLVRELREGDVIRVLQADGQFVHVSLGAGIEGWAPSDSVGVISRR